MECTKCGRCLNAVDRIPRLLRCGHTYCDLCVQSHPKKNIRCTRCKNGTPKASVIVNKDLLLLLRGVVHKHHLLTKRETDRCPFHLEDRIKVCAECEQHVCEMCSDAHSTYDCARDMSSMQTKAHVFRALACSQVSYWMFSEKLEETAKEARSMARNILKQSKTIAKTLRDSTAIEKLKDIRKTLLAYADDTQNDNFCPVLQDFIFRESFSRQNCDRLLTDLNLRNSKLRDDIESLRSLKICWTGTRAIGDKLCTLFLSSQLGSEVANLTVLPIRETTILNPIKNRSHESNFIDDIISTVEYETNDVSVYMENESGEKLFVLALLGSQYDVYGLFEQYAFKLLRNTPTVVQSTPEGVTIKLGNTEYFLCLESNLVFLDDTEFASFGYEGQFCPSTPDSRMIISYSFHHFCHLHHFDFNP